MIENVYRFSCQVPVIIVRFFFNEIRIFLTEFRKMIENKILLDPVQWGGGSNCFMQTDGRTDGITKWQWVMTKLIRTFRNFVNAPKTLCLCQESKRDT
jgi:hypothetical protein